MGLYAVSGSNPTFAKQSAPTRSAGAWPSNYTSPASTASQAGAGSPPGRPATPLTSGSTGTYAPTDTGTGLGRVVGLQGAQGQANTDSLLRTYATGLAKGAVDRQNAPQYLDLQSQIGYNNSDLASKNLGFADARQAAANDYANSMALLANSSRGLTDKRWLLDEQQKLAQRYYDRLAAQNVDQTAAAQRQNPLLEAKRADNSALYQLTLGEGGRNRDRVQASIADATNQNALDKFNLNGEAATGLGWNTKGYKLRNTVMQDAFGNKIANYNRDIEDIGAALEKARIGTNANDRDLTEQEAQIRDQLAQLGRDNVGNEDKRQGDYLQYLYDISDVGRQEAENRLRAKMAADQQQAINNQIAQAQRQAQIATQRGNTSLGLQQTQLINSAPMAAAQQMTYWNQLAQQDPNARAFLQWLDTQLIGLTPEEKANYVAAYMQGGGQLRLPDAPPATGQQNMPAVTGRGTYHSGATM